MGKETVDWAKLISNGMRVKHMYHDEWIHQVQGTRKWWRCAHCRKRQPRAHPPFVHHERNHCFTCLKIKDYKRWSRIIARQVKEKLLATHG